MQIVRRSRRARRLGELHGHLDRLGRRGLGHHLVHNAEVFARSEGVAEGGGGAGARLGGFDGRYGDDARAPLARWVGRSRGALLRVARLGGDVFDLDGSSYWADPPPLATAGAWISCRVDRLIPATATKRYGDGEWVVTPATPVAYFFCTAAAVLLGAGALVTEDRAAQEPFVRS